MKTKAQLWDMLQCVSKNRQLLSSHQLPGVVEGGGGGLLVLVGQFSSSSPSLQSSVPSHRTLLSSRFNKQLLGGQNPSLLSHIFHCGEKHHRESSHLGRQVPSEQVRWSGGQVGCGQPDSSLKDFNVNNDFGEKGGNNANSNDIGEKGGNDGTFHPGS